MINGEPQALAGVVTVPPESIHESITRQVTESLRGVPEGQTMAVLNVRTGSGVNLAVAHKFNAHWETVLYVGKSGWQKPIEGGVSVAFSR